MTLMKGWPAQSDYKNSYKWQYNSTNDSNYNHDEWYEKNSFKPTLTAFILATRVSRLDDVTQAHATYRNAPARQL